MIYPLTHLTKMAYPGRLIVLGRDQSNAFNIVVYGVTGRSPSSQARRLVRDERGIWTEPTDPDVLKQGRPDLLVYPAVLLGRDIAVGNGQQTSDIRFSDIGSASQSLAAGMTSWSYEPDAPVFTPRISGCILSSGQAGLCLLRRGENGGTERFFLEFPLEPGRGKTVTTYAGDDRDPLPAFRGEPWNIELVEPSARTLAEAVYQALGPQSVKTDVRVAVACVFAKAANMVDVDVAIVNRNERTRP